MPKTYLIRATGFDRVEYEAEITAPSGSGTVELTGGAQGITFEAGQTDARRKPGVSEHQVGIAAFREADLTNIVHDATEGEAGVVVRKVASGEKVFQGFLLPDEYEDTPLAPQPDQVELRAHDGLTLLKNRSFGDLAVAGNPRPSVHLLLTGILNSLYSVSLEPEVVMKTVPQGFTDGPNDATTYPLGEVHYSPEAFKAKQDTRKEWVSQYDALEAIVKGFGMVLQQAPGRTTFFDGSGDQVRPLRWTLTQEGAINPDGTAPLWRGTVVYEGEVGISQQIDTSSGDPLQEAPRRYGRKENRVRVTHKHGPVQNFLQNPGFENFAEHWTFLNAPSPRIVRHAGIKETPDPTAKNQRYANLTYDADLSSGEEENLNQQFEMIRPAAGAALRISWSSWQDETLATRIEWDGDASISTFTEDVRAFTRKGETEIPITPLSRPIPKGTRTPVLNGNGDVQTHVTLRERAPAGAETLLVDADEEIKSSYTVLYLGFGTNVSPKRIPLHLFVPDGRLEQWSRESVQVAYQLGDGSRPTDTTPTIRFYLEASSNPGARANIWRLDDVAVQPIRGDQVLTETVHDATVDGGGDETAVETRVSSGPSIDSERRLLGNEYFTGDYNVTERITGDGSIDGFRVGGDATGDLSAGDRFWVQNAFPTTERYEVDFIVFEASPGTTRIETVGQVQPSEFTGTLFTTLTDRFSAFLWKRSPAQADTDARPLGQVLARERLRRHREKNERFEATERITPDSPRIWGPEVVDLNGTLYTVERAEASRTQGERRLTLLEYTDYGIN